MHYAHACSCGRYENTCKRLPQHTVIAIILYLDGTQATRKISGQSTKPVVLTLGNFTIPVMNKGCAKRILTYMPSPKATAKVVKRASADWLLSKRLVYHDAWRQMLAPLVAAQRNGGVYLYLPYTGASGAVQWHQKLSACLRRRGRFGGRGRRALRLPHPSPCGIYLRVFLSLPPSSGGTFVYLLGGKSAGA